MNCPMCGELWDGVKCRVCDWTEPVPVEPESGFARCHECGNLAMNPLPTCGTCGGNTD